MRELGSNGDEKKNIEYLLHILEVKFVFALFIMNSHIKKRSVIVLSKLSIAVT